MARRKHSLEEQAIVLEEIDRKRLSLGAAARKYGVATTTLYSWRRRAARGNRSIRRHRRGRVRRGSETAILRAELRTAIREMLPVVLREELASLVRSLARALPRKRRQARVRRRGRRR